MLPRVAGAALLVVLTLFVPATVFAAESRTFVVAGIDGPALLVAPPGTARIDVEVHGVRRSAGPTLPFAWGPLGHNVAEMRLRALRQGEPITVTITPAKLAAGVHLLPDDSALEDGIAGARGGAFVLGILFAIVLLQFAAFVLMRDPSIIWYLGVVLTLGLIEILRDGLVPHYDRALSQSIISVLDVLNGIAVLGFVVTYLRLRKEAPELFSVTVGVIGVVLVCGIALVGLPVLHPHMTDERAVLLIIGLVTLLAVSVARALSGFTPAWWLPPAILALFFSVFYGLAHIYAGASVPFLDAWAFEIEAVIATLLFGMAVLWRARFVVNERHVIERRLDEVTHEALHDQLTGALNRRGLFARVTGPRGRAGTLFFVDLDGFKAINDRYGHAAGDAALIEVVRTIREIAGDDAVIARLGGDEFVVVTPNADRTEADAVAMKIAQQVAEIGPADAQGRKRFGASVGHVRYDGIHLEIALRRADADAYTIKAEKQLRGN